VPRLHQVPRAEVTNEFVLAVYSHLFGDRDPVAEPGTDDGTTGDWWTTFANSPDVLRHAVDGFVLYQSPHRQLPPRLRELGQLRAGVAVGSKFVVRQHRLALQRLDVDDSLIDAICDPSRKVTVGGVEELVVRFVDCLVHDGGVVPDALFNALHTELGDEATLELTYVATMYVMHAILSRALRTEDDC
jgi:alkylhydroperoxidase family enzyme